MDSKLELAVLDSIVPTTLIDMTGLVVRRTPLYNEYDQLKAEYHSTMLLKLDDSLMSYMNDPNRNMADLQDWSKRQNVLQRSECIAPMVQTLLDETCTIPTRMREAYVKHWRRCLVRRSMAMIKFVQDETQMIMT
ncbi:hypothetical protein BDB01DRAFT_36517 [Pilobolus umbonatus]|nr:hypothetical protein BDB01DRAFT_36517 [Pilobolus umbonatus]